MAKQWYFVKDGKSQGPISALELKQKADSGELRPEDLVCPEDHEDWIKAAVVKGLFVTKIVTPPPLPISRTANESDTPLDVLTSTSSHSFSNTATTQSHRTVSFKFPSRAVISLCWLGVILFAVGAVWFAYTWDKAGRTKSAIAVGGDLWAKGEKGKAIEEYKRVLDYLVAGPDASTLYQRVIDYYVNKEDYVSARQYVMTARTKGISIKDFEVPKDTSGIASATETKVPAAKEAANKEPTTNPSTPTFSPADYAYDFSKDDQSIPVGAKSKTLKNKLTETGTTETTNLRAKALNREEIGMFAVEPGYILDEKWVRHGQRTLWYDEQRTAKCCEDHWLHGKLHGTDRGWNTNGKLLREATYVDGLLYGRYQEWFKNGQQQCDLWWLHKKKHGKETCWDEHGRKVSEGEWSHGERVGVWTLGFGRQSRPDDFYYVTVSMGRWTGGTREQFLVKLSLACSQYRHFAREGIFSGVVQSDESFFEEFGKPDRIFRDPESESSHIWQYICSDGPILFTSSWQDPRSMYNDKHYPFQLMTNKFLAE
jgi:hypothetical protein